MRYPTEFDFADFAALCPGIDVERFRAGFSVMLDVYGVIPRHTVGFHFSLDPRDPESATRFKELAETFSPVAIWAGTDAMRQHLAQLGYQATVQPYYEGGGFMVVLKLPCPMPAAT